MQQLYKHNAGQKLLKTPLWKLQSGLQKQISQIITESGQPLNTNSNMDKLQLTPQASPSRKKRSLNVARNTFI